MMPFKYKTLLDRIKANSVQSTTMTHEGAPCWIWTGRATPNKAGMLYGRITRRFTKGPRKDKVTAELAHRVVVRDIKGRRLSRRSVVKHLCNHSLCVNPAHLMGGTQRSNVRQCVDEGRHGNAYRSPVADEMRKAV